MVQQAKKQYEDDDGRVICSMDVAGMRWHDKRVRREEKAAKKNNIPLGNQMTRAESKQYTRYAMLAGLVIASIFSIAWILFVLFCTEIWFK
jgi:hypothetical protein